MAAAAGGRYRMQRRYRSTTLYDKASAAIL
jgi:hypothetical protein